MLTETFCIADDFCNSHFNNFQTKILLSGDKCTRQRRGKLSLSEQMTILIAFQSSGYRNFKTYYQQYVMRHLSAEFPDLISYSRFVRRMPRTLFALLHLMVSLQGKPTGISFVDSTPVVVCHNKRISRNRVFADLAARGKSTMGWFYGFKLHFVINDKGEIVSFSFTKGNVDDRKPLPKLARNLFGKLFGDRGYISKELTSMLKTIGVTLITSVKSSMKNRLMPFADKILLRKRFLIETINDQLKNEMQIEHTRHRSPTNFLVNLVSGLIAYTLKPKKPSLKIPRHDVLIAIP